MKVRIIELPSLWRNYKRGECRSLHVPVDNILNLLRVVHCEVKDALYQKLTYEDGEDMYFSDKVTRKLWKHSHDCGLCRILDIQGGELYFYPPKKEGEKIRSIKNARNGLK